MWFSLPATVQMAGENTEIDVQITHEPSYLLISANIMTYQQYIVGYAGDFLQ